MQNGSQNYYSKLLKIALYKAIPENYSPKLVFIIIPENLPKLTTQSGSQKLLSKALPQSSLQSGCPEAARLQICSKVILLSDSQKVFPKVVAESCSPKFRSNISPQSCNSSKLPCKVAPQSCFCSRKLAPKSAPPPQICSPKLMSRVIPNSCSPKLLKLPQKFLSKSSFQNMPSKAIPQSYRSSKQLFVNAATKPQNYSPNLFPKLSFKVDPPKKFPKIVCTGYGSKRNMSDRRPVQQAGNLAEKHIKKHTKTIARS